MAGRDKDDWRPRPSRQGLSWYTCQELPAMEWMSVYWIEIRLAGTGGFDGPSPLYAIPVLNNELNMN